MKNKDKVKKSPLKPNWNPPYRPHPAGVIGSGGLSDWIEAVYKNMPKNRRGHVFLYNISLETFSWPLFRKVWLKNYGIGSLVKTVTLLLPYETNGSAVNKSVCRHLNWLPLINFTDECFKYPEDINDVLFLCSRTQIGFVDSSKRDLRKRLGEYAFGVYMSLPKEYNFFDILSQAHENDDDQKRETSPETLLARQCLTSNVELILGAGIDEPFSTRQEDDGPYTYKLIIPIYSYAHGKREDPSRFCVIKEHVKLMALLWSHSKNPLNLTNCNDLNDSPILGENCQNKADRFDTTIAWCGSGLTTTGKIRKKFSLHKNDQEFRMLMPDYRPLIKDLTPKVTEYLSEMNDKISCQDCEIFSGQPFFLSTNTKKKMEKNFAGKALKVIQKMLNKQTLDKGLYPSFLLSGGSGSGKTLLAKCLKGFLQKEHKVLPEKNYMYLDIGDFKNLAEVTQKVEEIKRVSIKSGELIFLLIDEIHLAEPFQKFKELCYPLCDIYENHDIPFFIGFLTSLTIDKIKNKIYENEFCAEDFWRRLRHFNARVTAYSIGDLVILSACVLCRQFNREIEISKEVLAYILLKDYRLPSPSDICGFIASFGDKCKAIKDEAVRLDMHFFIENDDDNEIYLKFVKTHKISNMENEFIKIKP